MDHCLSVDEILRHVARELVASRGQATTVALACCCRTFEDSVLDELWETQEGLLPLLKSLPGDVWNRDENVGVPTVFAFSPLNYFIRKSFERLPTTSEWARFRNYARRMRKLRIPSTLGVLSPDVFWVLQLCAINDPLFPNLRILRMYSITAEFIPFIPLFLAPGITGIVITFDGSSAPRVIVASIFATIPKLCPNLQDIALRSLPLDPMITAAVSGMLLASNRNVLRSVKVDSPLTEEAREVICRLPNLRDLWVVVDRGTSLPPLVLPNLTHLDIRYNHDSGRLRMPHEATLGKLESVIIRSSSEQIGNFLEAFGESALAVSAYNTLSKFLFLTSRPWMPSYRFLLPFTQLRYLVIESSCDSGCSSNVDDDIIATLARAMPKLEILQLGSPPCRDILTGATAKGLVVLSHHCPNLYTLRIHFQVASLCAPTITEAAPNVASTGLRRDCALTQLEVGKIPVPGESVLVVALTLLLIFPHLRCVHSSEIENWEKVEDALCLARQIVDYSSKELRLCAPRSNFSDTSIGTILGDDSQ